MENLIIELDTELSDLWSKTDALQCRVYLRNDVDLENADALSKELFRIKEVIEDVRSNISKHLEI